MNKIKQLRKKRGWSLAEMERRSRVGHANLRRIELNKVKPRKETILKIAKALDVKKEELI